MASATLELRAQGIEELRRKADAGDAEALNNLAVAYWNGDQVSRDVAESERLLRLSAEKGYARAQTTVGYNYENGIGVPKDYKLAMEWYRRAADQNFPMGLFNVGALYRAGFGVPKDEDEAIKWIRRSAEGGFVHGQNMLGIMIANGEGTKADPVEAYKWFYISARQGYPPARGNVEKHALIITAADKERAQREGDEFLKTHRDAHKEMGTGFFISADGYILTCHHVVKGSISASRTPICKAYRRSSPTARSTR